ncbi:unnamed protein product [Pleuronectes platessa]|uniref:Uncharacterized protein n=1 Tax=Pleuronectes platessa TaxID=8262 RepID=A0A9N7URK2_PLEPL|nr:unnamed protein product [Pleuronectes platessa]
MERIEEGRRTEKNDKGSGGALRQPYFLRLRLWSSQPKTHTDRQWEDSAMTLHPSWAPSGSTEAMLQSPQRPAPGSLGPSTRGRSSLQQDPKVNSHPFLHFSVSFSPSLTTSPTSLSSEVNKELFQSDVRNREQQAGATGSVSRVHQIAAMAVPTSVYLSDRCGCHPASPGSHCPATARALSG